MKAGVADPDPGSSAFLTPGYGFGYGMNNPDHISESLEKFSGFKILKSVDADPGGKKFGKVSPGWEQFGSGMETVQIRDGKNSDPG